MGRPTRALSAPLPFICQHGTTDEPCPVCVHPTDAPRADLVRERTRLRRSAQALLDAIERKDPRLPGYINDLESVLSGEEVFDGSVG